MIKDLSRHDRQSVPDAENAFVVEYPATAIGDPDPAWKGKNPKSYQELKCQSTIASNTQPGHDRNIFEEHVRFGGSIPRITWTQADPRRTGPLQNPDQRRLHRHAERMPRNSPMRGRVLTLFGMFATTTVRNYASPAVGQWDVRAAWGGYHLNVNHGLNVDVRQMGVPALQAGHRIQTRLRRGAGIETNHRQRLAGRHCNGLGLAS